MNRERVLEAGLWGSGISGPAFGEMASSGPCHPSLTASAEGSLCSFPALNPGGPPAPGRHRPRFMRKQAGEGTLLPDQHCSPPAPHTGLPLAGAPDGCHWVAVSEDIRLLCVARLARGCGKGSPPCVATSPHPAVEAVGVSLFHR